MAKFRVTPRSHSSLQDWVAEEKGYFADEGLTDFDLVVQRVGFEEGYGNPLGPDQVPVQTNGAYEAGVRNPSANPDPGRVSNVNTFCHWAVNMATGGGHGLMWAHAYSWTISGLYVPPESPIQTARDLANVEVAVGYHSGSHFSTLLSMEKFLKPEEINLKFVGGPNDRMGLLLDRKVPAANGLGMPCEILAQNGFRKIVDNSFIQGFLISGDVVLEDAVRYFRALRRAQQDIDLDAQPYKHYLMEYSIPPKYHEYVKEVEGLAVPTRIVFEEYTKEMYEETRQWMDSRQLFDKEQVTQSITSYEEALMR